MVGGGEDEGVLRGDHDGLLVQLADHVQHVEAGHLHHQRLLVMPGQEQQALHQLLHAGGLLGDGVDALIQDGLVILAPAAEHVHIPLDDGDGRTQLMAGVGNELLLAVVAALDAVQHGVDDRGQFLQFVLHAGHVDAVAQVAGGEGGGHVCDVPDGGQHALVQAAVLAQEVDHPQKIQHHQRGHQARPDHQHVRQVIDDVQAHAGGVGDDDPGAGWIQGKAEAEVAVIIAGGGRGQPGLHVAVLDGVLAEHVALGRNLITQAEQIVLEGRSLQDAKHDADHQQRGENCPQQLAAVVQRDAEGQRHAKVAHDAGEQPVRTPGGPVEAPLVSGPLLLFLFTHG